MKKTFLLTFVFVLAAGLVFASVEVGNKAENIKNVGIQASQNLTAEQPVPVKKYPVVQEEQSAPLPQVSEGSPIASVAVDKNDIEAYKAWLADKSEPGDRPVILYTDVSETEPNDDYTTANAILCDDRVFCASLDINGGDAQDWFAFTLDDTYDMWDITLETHASLTGECAQDDPLGDSKLYLFDSDGVTQLAFNDDGGSGLYSLINFTLDPSGPTTYYAMVEPYSSSSVGDYHLTLDCVDGTPVGCPEDEILITFTTDLYGSETSWEVRDYTTDVLYASGSGYSSNTYYEEQVCVDYGTCYNVLILDSWGDGGPDYDIYFNSVLECSGSLSGYGGVVCPALGGGCPVILGRCCDYTDPENPVCTDTEEDDCAYEWTFDLNCTDDPCVPRPANDECADAILIDTFPTTDIGTCVGATPSCPDLTNIQDVWYEIDLPYEYNNVTIEVCGTVEELYSVGVVYMDDCACDDYVLFSYSFDSQQCATGYGLTMTASALPGGRSSILWPAAIRNNLYEGIEFEFTINVEDAGTVPDNDDCANAEVIGDVTDYPFSTVLASFDGTGECQTAPNVWYWYEATCDGQVTVDLCGSLYDTKLGIYEGDACPTLDVPVLPDPSLLQGGDTFGGAVDVGTLPASWTGTTVGYNDDYNEVCPFSATGAPDVVYSISPTTTGTYYMGLCNSTWDTKLYVYESTQTNPGDAIACNDDACGLRSELEVDLTSGLTYYIVVDGYSSSSMGEYQLDLYLAPASTMLYCNDDACGLQSSLSFPATTGETFYIEVGGFSTATGDGDISISCLPPPPNDDCADAEAIACGDAVSGTTLGANVDCPTVLNWNAVWYSFDVSETANTVTIDYCPTGDDGSSEIPTVGIVLYDACPTDDIECGDYILAYSYEFVACDNGTTNPVVTYANIPAGTYYLPVHTGVGMDFGFEITCEEFIPCTVECPGGAYLEAEICGDDTNGGCNATGVEFEDIVPGDVCGTAWADGTTRDTDWYRFTATEDGYMTWSMTAEFPGLVFMIDAGSGNCLDYTILGSNTAVECEEASLGFAVTAGTYWLWAGPSVFADIACDGSAFFLPNYVATLGWLPGTPEMTVDPTEVEGTAEVGATTIETLEVGNTGGGALTFTATVAVDPPAFSGRSGQVVDASTSVPAEYDFRGDVYGFESGIDDGYVPYKAPYDGPANEPGVITQGGEDIGTAVDLGTLPASWTGTTAGYLDDTDEECPYTGSTSPDVVYFFDATSDICMAVDLCLSGYDTKVYVYENTYTPGDPYACNDDYGDCALSYRSYVEFAVFAGNTYYIVVDGYFGDFGDYALEAYEVDCPEPPPDNCPEINTIYGQTNDLPTDSWSIATSEVDPGYYVQDNFSGVTDDIEGVHFWGLDIWNDGAGWYDCDEDPTEFIVTFYEDDAGAPGAMVATFTQAVTGVGTGLFYAGFELKSWTFECDPAVSLSDGWLGIQGAGSPDCWFLWCSSHSINGDGESLQNDAPTGFDRAFCLLNPWIEVWLSLQQYSGTVLAGDPAIDIGATMDAAELEVGTYTGSVTIVGNDPDPLTSTVVVPVTFNVVEPVLGFPYLIGDCNMYNGVWPPARISGDVTYLVGYFRQQVTSQPCIFNNPSFGDLWASADANGNCSITPGDVTKLVNVFRGTATTQWCGDDEPEEYFLPLWINSGDAPVDPPPGWTGPGYGGGPNQICENVSPPMGLKIIPGGADR